MLAAALSAAIAATASAELRPGARNCPPLEPVDFVDPVVPGLPKPEVIGYASLAFGERHESVPVDSIVMHTTEVDLFGTLGIFTDPNAQVSAHFTIAADGTIYQHVATGDRAWHATYYNGRSIGIEMVGFAHSPDTWNDANLDALTDLLAWLSVAYDIELTRPGGNAYDFPNDYFDAPGVVAHGQIQPWNRTDPGPYFPWDDVLAEAQAKAVPEPTVASALTLGVGAFTLRRRSRRA